MIVKGWIKYSLWAAAASVALPSLAPWSVLPQTAFADDVDQALQQNIDQQLRVLLDPQNTIGQKEEAARLLVERADAVRGGAVRKALIDVLSNGKHDSQLAVAHALAQDSHPDEAFIDVLVPLLGRDRASADLAARALANYQDNPQALQHAIRVLDTFINDHRNDDALRATVIRAMGNIVDKQAVVPLMDVIQDTKESPAVVSAGCDALVQITGHEDFAHDVPRWVDWWAANSGVAPDQFKEQCLTRRLNISIRHEEQLASLREHLYSVLSDAYSRVSGEAARTELALRWLNDAEPAIKLSALRIVADSYTKTGAVAESIRIQIRQMIGDSSTRVRLEAVRTLEPINDAGALDALLRQLELENNPDVQAEIAKTLGPLQNVKAVGPLLGLLTGEHSLHVREEAALSLSTMGDQIRAAKLEQPVANALKAVLVWAKDQPGTQTLRENIMDALSKLRLWELRPIFEESSKNNGQSSTQLRRLAYLGLGNIDAPSAAAADDVASNLATDLIHETDNPPVELAIIQAIGTIGTITQSEALLTIVTNPNMPADMRDHAWQAIVGFFNKPGTTAAGLAPIVTAVADFPSYQRDVLMAKISILKATGDEENLAIAHQDLGRTYVRLGKFDDAAANFQEALDYWRKKGLHANDATVETLTHQLFESRLSARQYDQAAKLGGQSITEDPSLGQYFGVTIRNEVDRLQKSGDVKAASDLIDAALTMHPPLPANYVEQLHEARDHPIPPAMPGVGNP